jgi:hypothetical protein
MAHEPKLSVFKFYLRPTITSTPCTFRDFLNARYEGVHPITDKFTQFFTDFLTEIKDENVTSEAKKKAISLKETESADEVNKSINRYPRKAIIDGRIKGGKFGRNRSIGDVDDPKKEHGKLDHKKIVFDEFYFLLYTPYGSTKCVLILHGYSDDHVNDLFVSFIRKQLKTEGFYKPVVESFCPNNIKENFKENSFVKELIFREDMYIQDIEEKNSISTSDLIVEIKITARNEGETMGKFSLLKKKLRKIILKPDERQNSIPR